MFIIQQMWTNLWRPALPALGIRSEHAHTLSLSVTHYRVTEQLKNVHTPTKNLPLNLFNSHTVAILPHDCKCAV